MNPTSTEVSVNGALCYKLTDENHCTRGPTQWGEGVEHSGTGKGGLCGPGWIHAYSHPLLAVFLNPTHANFPAPVLWEARGFGARRDDRGLKIGLERLRTERIIPLPEVTIQQRVAFGILCAKEVCSVPAWRDWAERWLAGDPEAREEAAAWASASAAAGAAAGVRTLDLVALAQKAVTLR